jgi:hypothetical protein
MLGRATLTTVASMNASPEPSTVAATTQRPRGDPNAIAGSAAGGWADVVIVHTSRRLDRSACDHVADQTFRSRCPHTVVIGWPPDEPMGASGELALVARSDSRQARRGRS